MFLTLFYSLQAFHVKIISDVIKRAHLENIVEVRRNRFDWGHRVMSEILPDRSTTGHWDATASLVDRQSEWEDVRLRQMAEVLRQQFGR